MSSLTEGPLAPVHEWPVDHVAALALRGGVPVHAAGDLDRSYWLASVTKPLVATAVLLAVEEGVVALDDPAGPEGATVAHLLAHASGLGLDGLELARPGRRRIYSNAGYEVLGQALAAATGMEVAEYLTEGVLAPLGMATTSLRGSPAWAGHGTAADLGRWLAELQRPALLAAETVARATSVAFAGLDGMVPGYGKQSPNDWGLGFELKAAKDPHWTAPGGDPATFGHFGRSGTFVWVDPAADVALVVLTDQEFDDWARPRWPSLSRGVLDALA